MSATAEAKHEPEPRKYYEKIGDRDHLLEEHELHAFDDLVLWPENPRLIGARIPGTYPSEEELEQFLRMSRGYDKLARSIGDVGQLEPIYAWKRKDGDKYLVLEGATRVTVVRELYRKSKARPESVRRPYVRAKILPEDFSDRERVILLARIHVRGAAVRAWNRYIQAKFIHDNVTLDGTGGIMNASEMANYMGKSVSWVTRLWHAYDFATKFIDHVDDPDVNAERVAINEFSTLEELSKATEIGPKLRDYKNPDHDQLREDVFDMVKNEVFKEYRDARFMRDFYSDPDKWAQLKTGEKHIASRLASEVKANASSLKAKIAGMEAQIERAIGRSGDAVDEEDVEHLQRAIEVIQNHLHPGLRPLRRHVAQFTVALEEASLSDIRQITKPELEKLDVAYDHLKQRIDQFAAGRS